ncbi:MAG: tetratricopeptide repeat protein [Muribaculaceae bacterium]|nr:tetratricopeptide repeat protein [Muribaculaceae bacterium]
MTLSEIKEKINTSLSSEEGIQMLTEYIEQNPKDDEALTLRGMKYWGLGQRANAINDYLKAIEINPESKAKLALKATNEILDYYNKDLYNP